MPLSWSGRDFPDGLDRQGDRDCPEEVMLPAVGQGALAVQCRKDDQEMLELLEEVNDPVTERAIIAERTFLQAFEGGCHLPIAGRATVDEEHIRLRGLVASPLGHSGTSGRSGGDGTSGAGAPSGPGVDGERSTLSPWRK